jgi:uncharacterized protein (DUF433 family)
MIYDQASASSFSRAKRSLSRWSGAITMQATSAKLEGNIRMSKVISIRLKDDQVERLERAARQFGRRLSETAALLLEESLRHEEFTWVEFRDSPVGRQAYIQGTRLAVWQVAWLARYFDGDADRIAAHLGVPGVAVASALAYAAAYPAEIEPAIADNSKSLDELKRLIPKLEAFEVAAAAPSG